MAQPPQQPPQPAVPVIVPNVYNAAIPQGNETSTTHDLMQDVINQMARMMPSLGAFTNDPQPNQAVRDAAIRDMTHFTRATERFQEHMERIKAKARPESDIPILVPIPPNGIVNQQQIGRAHV